MKVNKFMPPPQKKVEISLSLLSKSAQGHSVNLRRECLSFKLPTGICCWSAHNTSLPINAQEIFCCNLYSWKASLLTFISHFFVNKIPLIINKKLSDPQYSVQHQTEAVIFPEYFLF